VVRVSVLSLEGWEFNPWPSNTKDYKNVTLLGTVRSEIWGRDLPRGCACLSSCYINRLVWTYAGDHAGEVAHCTVGKH
jgi:hypothetical protein